ncbi:hypothetical protein [Empedobacter falsenii]|uniref:Uncharacterized protein n=1 Tax=Empedobacter falsenii TaxID=343874 RepID=A0ABY8V4D7_9FLAO|nr:hypothetical protein [Empedobacter falsenii]WIH96526.1 hypothetical protein OBA43_09610 [Empedobacter falsenii]
MGRNINNSVSKKIRIREQKSSKNAEKYSTFIFFVYTAIIYLLYITDEIILLNVKTWYYFIFYLFHVITISLILNIPFIKNKLFESNELLFKILGSLVLAFFISMISYFGFKYLIKQLAEESTITENCEIFEIKKGRYRRGGDYYNLKINFKGNNETIKLDNYLFQKLENADLKKNHSIVKAKPSIFNIYVLENIHIQSKNLPN